MAGYWIHVNHELVHTVGMIAAVVVGLHHRRGTRLGCADCRVGEKKGMAGGDGEAGDRPAGKTGRSRLSSWQGILRSLLPCSVRFQSPPFPVRFLSGGRPTRSSTIMHDRRALI